MSIASRSVQATLAFGMAVFFLPAVPLKAQITDEEIKKTPPIVTSKPVDILKTDDQYTKLAKSRYNLALKELGMRFDHFWKGKSSGESLIETEQRFLHIGLEIFSRSQERSTFLKEMHRLADYTHRVAQLQETAQSRVPFETVRANQLLLEIEMLQLKAK